MATNQSDNLCRNEGAEQEEGRNGDGGESETDRLLSGRLCASSEPACTRAFFVLCCVIPLCAVDPLSLYSHPPITTSTSTVVDKAIWICSTPFSQVKVSSLVFGRFPPCVPRGGFSRRHCARLQRGRGLSKRPAPSAAHYFKPTWCFSLFAVS